MHVWIFNLHFDGASCLHPAVWCPPRPKQPISRLPQTDSCSWWRSSGFLTSWISPSLPAHVYGCSPSARLSNSFRNLTAAPPHLSDFLSPVASPLHTSFTAFLISTSTGSWSVWGGGGGTLPSLWPSLQEKKKAASYPCEDSHHVLTPDQCPHKDRKSVFPASHLDHLKTFLSVLNMEKLYL